MLKLRQKSFMVSQIQQKLLGQHIDKLIQRSQQIVNEKIQRQMQKQAKVDAVQVKFMEWAKKKEVQIKQKLQKSSRKKSQHISQIVKKCKNHEKYLGQKLKQYQNKKKANLRQAWIVSSKHKKQTDQSASKNISPQKSPIKIFNQLPIQSSLKKKLSNKGKYHNKKEYLDQLYYISSPHIKISTNNLKKSQQINYLTQPNEEDQQKNIQRSHKILYKFKQNALQLQNAKVQQLGQHLQKIEKGRLKKLENIKKLRKKIHSQGIYHHQKKQNKVKYEQKTFHESQVREKRVRNWSQTNKSKREQLFQNQLQTGNNYLESQKLKYMKNKLEKKIQIEAVQQKLYFQRLNH